MSEAQAYTLIMNPSSGGGRSKQLLPAVEGALDALRIPFRVERTRSLEHGVDLAFEAVDSREIPVVMSGDGLIGAVGGALAGVDTPVGLIPAGRGNDLARGLGIPTDPTEAVACLAACHTRSIDVGDANGKRFLGIASVGFDSDANRIANEAKLLKGQPVYAYAALKEGIPFANAAPNLTADVPAMLERIRKWRDGYLRWGRDTLGFAVYLFYRPGARVG